MYCFPYLLYRREGKWAKSVFFMYIPFESQNQKHDSSVTHVQNFVKVTSFGTINIVEQVDGVYRTRTNAALP